MHANQGMAIYDYERASPPRLGLYRARSRRLLQVVLGTDALHMRQAGPGGQAAREKPMALAERDSHPVTWPRPSWRFSVVHLMRREPLRHGFGRKRRSPLCTDFAMPLLLGQARVYLRLGACGARTAGRRHSRDARGDRGHLRDRRRHGDGVLPLRAGTRLRRCGEAEEGLAAAGARRSTRSPRLTRPTSCRAIAHQGRAAVLAGSSAMSGAGLVPSIAGRGARARRALASELRAALRLAGLSCRSRARCARQETFLRQLMRAFNEGFDTPDLVEAKSLLQKLSHHAAAPR